MTPLIGLEAAGMTMESVPDESQFVVLKPSEIYSLDRVFNFHISIDANDRDSLLGPSPLADGPTWYYPRASNVEWRSVENHGGLPWSDPITSVAMPFMIEKEPSFCRLPVIVTCIARPEREWLLEV